MKHVFRKVASLLTLTTALVTLGGCEVTFGPTEEENEKNKFTFHSYSIEGTFLGEYEGDTGLGANAVRANFGGYSVQQDNSLTAVQNGALDAANDLKNASGTVYETTFYSPKFNAIIYRGYNRDGLVDGPNVTKILDSNGETVKEEGHYAVAIKIR
jgi:hypothetical protein